MSIYPEDDWRKDFELLLKRVQRRAGRRAPAMIEEDVTTARAEVRSKRRESRRSA